MLSLILTSCFYGEPAPDPMLNAIHMDNVRAVERILLKVKRVRSEWLFESVYYSPDIFELLLVRDPELLRYDQSGENALCWRIAYTLLPMVGNKGSQPERNADFLRKIRALAIAGGRLDVPLDADSNLGGGKGDTIRISIKSWASSLMPEYERLVRATRGRKRELGGSLHQGDE